MKRIARGLIVGAITFVIGFSFANTPVIETTLEEISNDIGHYEGRLVEVESFAQYDHLLEWQIGEPFEKAERFTILELTEESTELMRLKGDLSQDWSPKQYYRVRVRASGLLEDNCNDGFTSCCFGETMSLKSATLTVIGPVTNYSRPDSE